MTDHTITQAEINKYNSLSDLIKGLGEGSYNLNITNEINIIKNFTIDQTLNINAGGTLNINNYSTLNINVKGTLNINVKGMLKINDGWLNIVNGLININGGVLISTGDYADTSKIIGGKIIINNGGVIDVSNGGLNIDSNGEIIINNGGTIDINEYTITINVGTIYINNGGTMNINEYGALMINSDGQTIIDEDGILNIKGGTLNNKNDGTLKYDKIIWSGGQIFCKKLNDGVRIILTPESKEIQKNLDVYNSVLSSFGVINPSVESFDDYNNQLYIQFKNLLDSELSDIEASDTIWPKQAITSQISKLKEEIKNLKYKNQLLLLLLTKSYNQQSKIQNNDLLKLMYKF